MMRGISLLWVRARQRAWTNAGGIVLLGATVAQAGPYSTGLVNETPGAIDPAIPGFVDESLNPAFVGWATGVASYLPAPGVDPGWNEPTLSLGPVTGNNFDIVSLGESIASPGRITLSFNGGIRNSIGPDFAVFENAFGSGSFVFAELAYVEVSSNGSSFARFPSASLTPNPVAAYGSINPTNVHNLAGKHVNDELDAFGTPFDLADLAGDRLVQNGQVNLRDIRYVRLIDIAGDGTYRDSSDRPIYDATPTFGSGGFDLEAVGVLHDWMPGDANFDGIVNATDLGILGLNWQHAGREFWQGDFNHDGLVNVYDLLLLATHWQQADTAPAPAFPLSVPEPSVLMAISLCPFLGRRRTHL